LALGRKYKNATKPATTASITKLSIHLFFIQSFT
jgi:hypothetical protein